MLKITDELQKGVPNQWFTDKTFDIDFSEFDITTKDGKKAAMSKASKVVSRFSNRERRSKGRIWSKPKVDLEKGTATTSYSVVNDIATEAFYEAGKLYNFSSPVESEVIIGRNWYECH